MSSTSQDDPWVLHPRTGRSPFADVIELAHQKGVAFRARATVLTLPEHVITESFVVAP